MDAPSFYAISIPPVGDEIVLSEEGSRHAVSVLRMQEGATARLVDGRGGVAMAVVRDAHKKKCVMEVLERRLVPDGRHPLILAVSLLKNPSRFEWMLEKACEIGIRRVIPVLAQRTERQRVRQDRLESVALSAMLQSQQAWMTEVAEPTHFEEILSWPSNGLRWIAHCLPGKHRHDMGRVKGEVIMLIGPEGDFSPEEVSLALSAGFQAVGLGPTRLRSETAAVVAASVICIGASVSP